MSMTLRGFWLSVVLCGLLGMFPASVARAATLVHPDQAAQVHTSEAPPLALAADGGNEDNPWSAFIWAPMYLPFPWSALLDGYVPWGRYPWVKNLTAGCLMGCGSCMIGVFPFTLVFAVISLVLAVVALGFAAYVFITEGFKGGCCGVAGRGANVADDCFSVYNGIMCLSYVMCTPWLGFKLIQRGWYAFRTPIEPTVEEGSEAPPQKAPHHAPAPEEQPAPESMKAPAARHALAY